MLANRALLGFFICCLTIPASGEEQDALKLRTMVEVQKAAAGEFNVPEESVIVKLSDRRLVLPDCIEDFKITFPFSDRVTTKLECEQPSWTGYLQINLIDNAPAFAYRRNFPKGYVIKRGDAVRRFTSSLKKSGTLITNLNEITAMPLIRDVEEGEILRGEQFDRLYSPSPQIESKELSSGWVLSSTLSRGSRIARSLVSWQQIVGRVPSDALTEQTDLSLFEANRTLVSGELLRRSNVQLAPAIRKDEEITVTLRRGALTVETQLIAMENGAIGDEIIVVNKDSGRELRARVTGVRRMELL